MADPHTRLAYLKPLRDWLAAERARLKAEYLRRPQPDRNLRGHAEVVDELIRRLAEDIDLPSDVALMAVGGYGRGFLFPASDVDVLVLVPENLAAAASIEAFVSLMWDVGLEPGISVRTMAECLEEAKKDITVDTSMLEARWLWGDAALAQKLMKELTRARSVKQFLEAKLDEQRKRHTRHHDIALNLEPNIKESPGGLRDLQTVLWIARAASIGGDIHADWSQLAREGLITADEAKLIAKHRRVLIDLRIRLHYLAGRREDRLVFDYQNAIAAQLKLKATRLKRASEVLMRRYYLSAKVIWQLNSILLANLSEAVFAKPVAKKRDVVQEIDDEFELVNGNIAAIDTRIFRRDPRAIFRAFLALQRTRDAEFFAADTLRALWREVPRIGPAFRDDPEVNRLFLDIMKSERLTFTLRRMSRYGILGRYLPAFGRIVGQMQHDLFHVYTVDEHILMVLRNMRRLVLPRFAHEFPFCHELAREFEGPHLLYLACLFHDIAKGRGGDHSTLGTRDARRFCRQLELSDADTDLVAWLVEMHLVMSATAQKQDLSDPEVISHFAARVGTERRLTALYLLTVSDIRGTSPHVWNGWKARLLEELFRTTRRLLRGDSVVNEHWLSFKRNESLSRLGMEPDTATPPAIWSHVDDRYFQRFDVDDLTWHARAIGDDVSPVEARVHARAGWVHERGNESGDNELFEVLVMASDRSGLFARLTSAFERMQLDIVSARIYTTEHGYALDTFLVLPKQRIDEPRMVERIERELARAIQRPEIAAPTVARLSRQVKHFPLAPEVNLRPARGGMEEGRTFELGIICSDRPGLLSAIAHTLHEADISVHDARITTLGSRAEDVFVIEGKALAREDFSAKLKEQLLAVMR